MNLDEFGSKNQGFHNVGEAVYIDWLQRICYLSVVTSSYSGVHKILGTVEGRQSLLMDIYLK
jgi:hypothetical protein